MRNFGEVIGTEPSLSRRNTIAYSAVAGLGGFATVEGLIAIVNNGSAEVTGGVVFTAGALMCTHAVTKLRGGYHREEQEDTESSDQRGCIAESEDDYVELSYHDDSAGYELALERQQLERASTGTHNADVLPFTRSQHGAGTPYFDGPDSPAA